MVQVYKEPLARRYYGSAIGEAMLFRVFAYLSAIVLAFVVAYATGGFWVRLKPYNTQATVHYSQDAYLLFEGAKTGQAMLWSTSPVINAQFYNAYTAANVEVTEEDLNNDGKVDIINFRAWLSGTFPVYSVKAILQFQYALTGALKLDMYGLAYVSHSSPVQGAALYTDGELTFAATTQLTEGAYSGIYNTPILNSTTPSVQIAAQPTMQLQMQSILKGYLDRNYTTVLTDAYPVWTGGTRNGFELNMRIRIPPQQIIYYRPQVIEMLKFGWIQWLATFIVLWYLLQWAEWFVFYYKLVETRIVSDALPPRQRF